MNSLIVLPLIPLLGALMCQLLHRINPRHALSGWVATGAVLATFCYALTIADYFDLFGETIKQEYWVWMRGIPFGFTFDPLSIMMTLLVTGVGALIHLYAIGYMKEDENKARFFSYLNFFISSMLVLVLGSSLPILFIGWEGVGICSFLLIGFWRTNRSYGTAASKAFIMNRIGDAGLLFGMGILLFYAKTLDFSELRYAVSSIPPTMLIVAGVCLFLGVAGKSAQFPLYTWLPDAMAGPTPVSALIHAATMVTAGVYLMSRMDWLFFGVPAVSSLGVAVGVATALVAGVTAMAQYDIKKVLAYSTVSQLGLMVACAASGAWVFALFHVLTHAFFKATLFLGAGSVIHGCHHEQDMRKMGGLISTMPQTACAFLVATIAIAGIAPFSGYYSKHGILEALADTAIVPHWSLTLISLLTALYMGRAFGMTFLGAYKGHAHPHEVPFIMWGPVTLLALFSGVAGAYYLNILPMFLTQEFHSFVELHPIDEFISTLPAVGALLVGIIGGVYGWERWLGRSTLLSNNFYLDTFYREVLVKRVWAVVAAGSDLLERTLFERFADFFASTTEAVSHGTREIQTGKVQHYALGMLAGVLLLVGVYILG